MSQQSLAELKEEIHHFFENYTQTHQQLSAVEMSLDPQIKRYRDLKNSIDTAHDDGRIEGIEIGKEIGKQEGIELGKQERALEIAKNLKPLADN